MTPLVSLRAVILLTLLASPAFAQDGMIPESSVLEAWQWAVERFTPLRQERDEAARPVYTAPQFRPISRLPSDREMATEDSDRPNTSAVAPLDR